MAEEGVRKCLGEITGEKWLRVGKGNILHP